MTIFSKIKELFKSPYDHKSAMGLYVTIVQQSRLPVFYHEYEVGDTIDGRFEMVALHTYLILRTLRRGSIVGINEGDIEDNDESKELSQAVFDLMFADMDQNLRELSIGDTGVAKRVTKMAERFYGRMAAYDLVLNMTDDNQKIEELCKVVIRNIYRTTPVQDPSVEAMARYMINQQGHLDTQGVDTLTKGTVSFLAPTYSREQGT
jgi:cytochrome b pre-mRNA-processing protein 3